MGIAPSMVLKVATLNKSTIVLFNIGPNVNLPFECYQLENELNKYTRRNCVGKQSDRSETKT